MRDHRKDYKAMNVSGEIPAKEAAIILGVSANTLKKLRTEGKGPSSRQVHKRLVAYNKAECEAAAEAFKAQFGNKRGPRKAVSPAAIAAVHPAPAPDMLA